jgi:SAP domain
MAIKPNALKIPASLQLKNNELKELSRSLGLSPAGTKSDMQERITSHVTAAKLHPIKSLVAIDVGYKNLGFVHISNSSKLKIIDWGLLHPDMPTEYDVYKYLILTLICKDYKLAFETDTET